MDFPALVDRYALRHDCAHSTVNQLRIAARLFDRWSGVEIENVSDDALNAWLVYRRDSGLRPTTVRGNRTSILMLWRDAFENGETAIAPRRVRRIKCPECLIDGFDAGQMAALLKAADELRGRFRGSQMPRRIWWRSLLLAYWDSSLRLGDLESIERGWIWPQPDGFGCLTTIQHKTGRQTQNRLRPETMAAIDECMAIGGDRRLIWAGFLSRRRFYPAFKQLAQSAGLTGTSKFIRRGSASEVEAIQPGAGSAHLGHRTPGLFEKSYRVDRIVRRQVPLPPPISG